jgi:PAS domain S-box-containing protein
MAILDDGLDEMAARAYQGLPLRMVATVGVAGMASLIAPWPLCLGWLGAQAFSEGVSVIATRPQAQGRKVSTGRRIAHLATVVSGCGLWTVLGGMLWMGGTAEGVVSAMVLWLSVVFFAQNNAYQSTTGFLVAGGIPALGMLAVMLGAPGPLHHHLLPVIGMLVISLGFVVDGVMRTLAIRRRVDDGQARLAASESQYRMLADNLSDVLWMNEFYGKRIFVSPSVTRALGYAVDEIFDDNFSMVHPDDADRVRRLIRDTALARGQNSFECRMLHKDGRVIWMETNVDVAASPGGDGEPMVISVSRNIDKRKELERQLVDARRRAESAAAAKSDFLANMTHELRTPLNAIIGFAGVLKGSPRLAPEDARHVHLIGEASDALLGLVNTVLDFSRLEAGAVQLESIGFDPAETARTAAALMAEQASAKGLDLSVQVEGDVRPLQGDATRLRQVLLNFLSNAIKFTATGEVVLHVRQAPPADGGAARLRMAVADSGIGVSAAQIEHLFDRFTQADETVSRQYGGTGLGLAICKRTLELMGGDIGCDSTPGQGSTFWFEVDLPLATELPQDASAPDLDGPQNSLRLLLVEDVAVNRELVAALLSPFDIRLETAENGREALNALAEDRFDLVLMDVQMPVMDGLAATRAIRSLPHPHAKRIPIVAMTANVLPDQVQRCREAGMDDHIGKPISPAALLGAISRWSGPREAEAQVELRA